MAGIHDKGPSVVTLTFLLTDIEGSTRLHEVAPDAMQAACARHDEIIAKAVKSADGVLLKARGEGDSAFAVFDDAASALAAAVDLQLALAAESWPTATPIRVRTALHTGEVVYRDGDYYGTTVNRAARIRSIGHGGQTVLSRATKDAAASLPPGAELRDLGLHRLKDLSEPERIYQLCHPGLADDFPPLRSLETLRHNLPLELTTFVGRETEIAELIDLLAQHRLVTVTGMGGLGKTRLALQVAAEELDRRPGGVWFADLSVSTEEARVPEVLARALSLRDEPGRTIEQTICERLREAPALVLLDNCEHVVEAAARLADALLLNCADVRILATSRESISIAGEAVWRIPPLGLPRAENVTTEDLSGAESVRLFVARADLVGSRVSLAGESLHPVATICRRLDGIPLAIELAAAQVSALTPEQIADRLHDRFRLLARGSRTAPTRQQTLRATVDWSHGLLEPPEQRLFRRLAVFAGGFTLEAAEEVCGGDEETDVLSGVDALVQKSLVLAETTVHGPRYAMLETIREYARERLIDSGESAEVASRHLAWCTRLAEVVARVRMQEVPQEDRDRLDIEMDNMRAALDGEITPPNPSDALRLAGALGDFWWLRGHVREGESRLARALEADPAPTQWRVRALQEACGIAWLAGNLPRAQSWAEEALQIAEHNGWDHMIGRAYRLLGNIVLDQGDNKGATRLYERSAEAARRDGDMVGLSTAIHNLGEAARERGDFLLACSLYEESLALDTSVRDANAYLNLGLGQVAAGLVAEAAASLSRSLVLASATREEITLSLASMGAAAVLAARNVAGADAAQLLGFSAARNEQLGFRAEPHDLVVGSNAEAAIRAALGDQAFETAFAEGRLLSPEEGRELTARLLAAG